MLTIRLFRTGRRNQPSFKIVVTDKRRSSTRGRFVEEVGIYNPLTKQRNLKGDRVKYWMSVGARPSATVHNMLVAEKVIEAPKIAKHKPPQKPAEQAAGQAVGQAVPPKAEETPAEPEKPAETASQAPQEVPEEPKATEEVPKT